jgi:hypothetical protein
VNKFSDKREHARYNLSASALMSAFSDAPLDVKDISAGGFRVVVPKEPQGHEAGRFSIHLPNLHLGEFLGRVAWALENPTRPPSWTIGVSMDVHGGDASRLREELLAATNTVD